MSTGALPPPLVAGERIVFGSFDPVPIWRQQMTPFVITPGPKPAKLTPPAPAPSAWSASAKPPAAVLSAAGLPPSLGPQPAAVTASLPIVAKPPLADIKREHISLTTRLQPFLARGLVNAGNLCFMNAVLQALLASRPFYNLCLYLSRFDIPSRCVFLETFARFIGEFPQGQPIVENRSLYAEYLIRLVDERLGKRQAAQHRRQEDAHEFLTFLLDGLHEDLLSLRGKSGKKEKQSKEEWNEVGRKQKVATVLESAHAESAISWIFEAHVKSTVRRDGGKASTRVEPMTSVPLDVLYGGVQEALHAFFSPETLQGVTDGSSVVQARRHMHLHTLPPVLILHVKRFGFETGLGSQKVTIFFRFPLDFVFDQELLAQNLPVAQRSYSLLAVIAHHGEESNRGHYTADVRQASGRWLCFDDATVYAVSAEEVLRRQAYLLFYTLQDSM